jgi:hypothetical protein
MQSSNSVILLGIRAFLLLLPCPSPLPPQLRQPCRTPPPTSALSTPTPKPLSNVAPPPCLVHLPPRAPPHPLRHTPPRSPAPRVSRSPLLHSPRSPNRILLGCHTPPLPIAPARHIPRFPTGHLSWVPTLRQS